MPKKARTCAADRSRDPQQLGAEHLSVAETRASRVLCEVVAIPVDQFARLLRARRSDTSKLLSRLEDGEYVCSRKFLRGEAPWIWLTGKGAYFLGARGRLRRRPPALASLQHRRAVHEVRLSLQASHPTGRWICETQFYAERGSGYQIPDGVFELGGKRQAILLLE
jgi:hypothetical protein